MENINYPPRFLLPFLEANPGAFCLDIGHLLLGREKLIDHLVEAFSAWIREIHLHGVNGNEEHLSLRYLPDHRLRKWLKTVVDRSYRGFLTWNSSAKVNLRNHSKS